MNFAIYEMAMYEIVKKLYTASSDYHLVMEDGVEYEQYFSKCKNLMEDIFKFTDELTNHFPSIDENTYTMVVCGTIMETFVCEINYSINMIDNLQSKFADEKTKKYFKHIYYAIDAIRFLYGFNSMREIIEWPNEFGFDYSGFDENIDEFNSELLAAIDECPDYSYAYCLVIVPYVNYLQGVSFNFDKAYAKLKEAFVKSHKCMGDELFRFVISGNLINTHLTYVLLDVEGMSGKILVFDGLKELIDRVTPSMVTGNIQNTGDMMIFRFHEANLESPMYFSKNDNDIEGHNCSDARNWLSDRRTSDKLTRWLLLDAADYIEQLFRSNVSSMETQVGSIFASINSDPGIRSSFRQMYFVFDGLRNTQRRGIYYQAVSAMLIPFDSNPKSSGPSANVPNIGYDKVQKMFVRFSKQARNYCAHNYFGSSVSNETVLYLIMGTVSAVLVKNQRRDKDSWYINANQVFNFINPKYVLFDNVNKVNQLAQNLLTNSSIDIHSAHVDGMTYSDYTPWDLLRALGFNTTMNLASEQSTTVREKYYLFTLAAYVIKWFEGLLEEDVENQFGKGIRIVFELSNRIVANYVYPHII